MTDVQKVHKRPAPRNTIWGWGGGEVEVLIQDNEENNDDEDAGISGVMVRSQVDILILRSPH